jgi:predicted Zn-dependent protease
MSGDPRVERFASLVAAQPENELFRFSLAQALDSAGRTDEAIPHFRFCVDAKADWMMPRILLGKLLLARGDRAGALPLLEDALRLAVDQDHEDPAAEIRALLSAGR